MTGFKKDDWDQIFSVWQSGQYRTPVIKSLPVKHSAIIDEFPLGRVELSLGPEGLERGILSMEPARCAQVNLRGESDAKAKMQEVYWLYLDRHAAYWQSANALEAQ